MDEAAAAARGRRDGREWVRVTRGAHRLAIAGDPWRADLAAWQLVLPEGAAFTHLTAAALHGLWMPPLPENLPIFVAMKEGRAGPERPGLVVSRHRAPPPHQVLGGLQVATIPELLVACGRHLGLVDLVVLIDSALYADKCTREEIRAASLVRRRGARALRAALAHADGRSESPGESMLRILLLSAGCDIEPQVGIDDDGEFVARGDLRLVGTRALFEYDGDVHLDRPQHRKDLKRVTRIEQAGYQRRAYTKEDVLHQAVGIIRDADLALARPHDPARVRAWHDLLRDSLHTPTGVVAFRTRLAHLTRY